MNYKLAKQLKDAGFPQGGEDRNGNWISPIFYPGKSKKIDMKIVYVPLLEEVIEELIKITNLEAVSNLYIKLNKK